MNNISKLVNDITKRKPKRVLLQLPEGLKSKSLDIAEQLEKKGIEVVISGDSCYGACDLQEEQAKKMNCDLLVHVGHSCFCEAEVETLYYPWEIDVNVKEKELEKITETSVALATTVQHLKCIDDVKAKLEQIGKQVEVLGQVLGCTDSDYKSEAVLFIGSGLFHPTNLRGKVYRYDIEKDSVDDITDICMKYEMKKQARIAMLKDAKTVGIIVSTKSGQFKDPRLLKQKLKEKDKKVFVILMNEITNPEYVMRADIFINTACPRLVEDFSNLINIGDVI